ncbi:MAG: 23S rRNA (pseudouridine(1915)-N(3))-methyltransferase RlmH [Fusobacteriaceae bacterium]
MNINIICIGKIKEKYINDGINEYLKRMTLFAKVKIIELREEGNDENRILSIKKEAQEIIKTLEKNKGYSILLDIEGRNYTSEDMAKEIEKIGVNGSSTINFIIGGSYGVTEEIREFVEKRLSFSKMTFPHQLMRLILIEQIYRWFGIIGNNKYHK